MAPCMSRRPSGSVCIRASCHNGTSAASSGPCPDCTIESPLVLHYAGGNYGHCMGSPCPPLSGQQDNHGIHSTNTSMMSRHSKPEWRIAPSSSQASACRRAGAPKAPATGCAAAYLLSAVSASLYSGWAAVLAGASFEASLHVCAGWMQGSHNILLLVPFAPTSIFQTCTRLE